MDISRFNGLRSDSHVGAFLLSLLGSPDLGNTESRETAEQSRCGPRIRLPHRARRERPHLYEDQLCNADHVHALIDLPTAFSIEKVIQLLKGSSSHWINSNNLVTGKFAWGRGYGAFSVSESNVSRVARYIADQEEHHRVRTFAEELKELIERRGLRWKMKEAVKTASRLPVCRSSA
jgi:Transposase IS200 like